MDNVDNFMHTEVINLCRRAQRGITGLFNIGVTNVYIYVILNFYAVFCILWFG